MRLTRSMQAEFRKIDGLFERFNRQSEIQRIIDDRSRGSLDLYMALTQSERCCGTQTFLRRVEESGTALWARYEHLRDSFRNRTTGEAPSFCWFMEAVLDPENFNRHFIPTT